MAVFCEKTGMRLVAPSKDESADALEFRRTHEGRGPFVKSEEDPDGWEPVPLPESEAIKPLEKPQAPSVERELVNKPAKGNK